MNYFISVSVITLSFIFSFISINLSTSLNSWALQLKDGVKVDSILKFENGGLKFEFLQTKEQKDKLLELYLGEKDLNYLKYYWGKPQTTFDKDFVKNNVNYMLELSKAALDEINKKDSKNKLSKVEYLIHDENGNLVGNIGMYNQNGTDEGAVAIFVSSQFKGKKLGERATKALSKLIKEKFVMENLYWECLDKNVGSNFLAKKMGFIFHIQNILDQKDPNSEYGKENVYKLKM
ncbi:MAG: GNAT family N-acetyltransferase [Oligoflexia bacterium]|nr:GNAT family N-acetyltransferase [Oligoflexia bacterium]